MQTVIEHTFDDEHERMRHLKDKDIDRYFELLDKSVEEGEKVALAIMCHAVRSGCVLIQRDRESRIWHYLHRSVRYPDCLQLTTWDEYGPVSDARIEEPSDFSYLMSGTVTAKVK